MDLTGRRALVVGFGRSGRAAARLLLEAGAAVRVLDRDPARLEDETARGLAARGVTLESGPHSIEQAAGSDLVVLSPGVPSDVAPAAEARRRGVEVIGEVELGARQARGRLLGITGSNGKSTTVTLASRMLAASGLRVEAGGNLGRPFCEMVLESDGPEVVHCLELSSFQCETLVQARFEVACILNVSPNHLDRHADFEAYVEAKLRLLAQQDASGIAILGADDPRVAEAASRARGRVAWFGAEQPRRPGVEAREGAVISTLPDAEQRLFAVEQLWSQAPHHVLDAMAAAAVTLSAGGTADGVRQGIAGFRGLPHRSETVPTARGPRFINDSKATTVTAAALSIAGAGRGAAVILGGRHKGGDLTPLRDALSRAGDSAVLIGEAADLMARVLEGRVPVRRAADLREAVRLAVELTGPHGTVLLAPACASFDMFADFEERGERFRAEVHALCGRPPETKGGAR